MAGMPLATVMVLWLMATLGAAAPVHAQAICPTPGSSTATLSGVVNSYWDGSNDAVLNAGELVHVFADAHIYDRHVPIIEQMLSEPEKPAPAFFIDPSVTDFYAFTKDSFRLEGYEPCPFEAKIPIAV